MHYQKLKFGLLSTVILATLAGMLSGCQTTPSPGMASITGEVIYLERIALPPTATISVILEDVSRMDVAATVLAKQTLSASSGPPFAFALSYDPADIDSRLRYGLRARIENEGQLLFINTSHIPAFDADPSAPVEVLVSMVSGDASRPAQTKPDAELTETYWKVIRVGDTSVATSEGQREPHIVMHGDGRVHGNSGCNTCQGQR